jgi:hypothetical protein
LCDPPQLAQHLPTLSKMRMGPTNKQAKAPISAIA